MSACYLYKQNQVLQTHLGTICGGHINTETPPPIPSSPLVWVSSYPIAVVLSLPKAETL